MRTVDYVSQIKEKTGSGQKVDEFPLVTYNTYLMILRIIRLIQGMTQRVVEFPMNNTVKALIQARWHKGGFGFCLFHSNSNKSNQKTKN